MADNPMAGSMKAMNIMMPLMSVYMCWILSAGIGLYWMAGSLVMILQQIFINLVLKNEDIDEIIEKNKDKAAAKAAKRKEKEGIYREKVLEASKVNAKNISSYSNFAASIPRSIHALVMASSTFLPLYSLNSIILPQSLFIFITFVKFTNHISL